MKYANYLYLLISFCCYLIPISLANAVQTHEIEINEEGFGKLQSNIYMGDTIKWTNTGSKPHQIQSKSGLFLDSGLLNPGMSFEHIFKRAVPLPQVRSLTNELTFIDKVMPEHELKFLLLNEPIIISPRDSLFLKNKPFNILIFLGENIFTLLPVNPISVSEVINIELNLDGIPFFSGNLIEFNKLNFVISEGFYDKIFLASITEMDGFRVFRIAVKPNALSVGLHVLNIQVKLKNGGVYDDTVRYTIFE